MASSICNRRETQKKKEKKETKKKTEKSCKIPASCFMSVSEKVH